MKRISWGASLLLVAGMTTSAAQGSAVAAGPGLTVGAPSVATAVSPTKINVMGLWAHPDDDAGATTPCGVWQDLYDVTCGIIMETRGEGGSNSVGPESGPDLGLRRENEDRTSHVRSGTVNVYNVDMVDFFYNTSAPLTAEVWQKEIGLRQTVRIIRETQPDILLASSTVAAGHGNHQYAQGRMVWEASRAAADPAMYPEQLTGPDAVQVWQVKKIVGGGATTGTGGVAGPNCTVGFTPAATNPFTVLGVWSGYDSPYNWLEGNVQNQPAGTPKSWAQVGREGGRAHPTQARVMEKGLQAPSCTRYSVTKSLVPFQPNGTPGGGSDEAILFGATEADPGGMPLGSMFHVDVPNYFVAPGVPFTATVSMRSGDGTLTTGNLGVQAPAGWTVSDRGLSGPVSSETTVTRSFTVTPPPTAVNTLAKISATFDNGPITAYNDTQVSLVQQVEGRFQRQGNQAEYDSWASEYTWLAGRSAASAKIGAGESITVPVVVTNRSKVAQSGTVTIAPPAGITADAVSEPFTDVPAGGDVTVNFIVTHTVPAALASTVTMPITTTAGDVTSSESLTMYVVPTTVIPELSSAPELDGTADAGVGYGPELSTAGKWEGADCASATDCGGASVAQLGWFGDDLYVAAVVVDDTASAAAPPERCFGHWLVDSVEILLDPRGDSADTSSTFKSGIFPFTDDPSDSNGNGVNGPCWSRDADNHQGFSTGPLAANVKGGLNAPGQEVSVSAVRNSDGTYVGGKWLVETKIPLADLPAAVGPTSDAPTGVEATNTVDPTFMGLNVTPYDSDQLNFIGDTRLAWSAIGGQQSEPARWGHAYLAGYTPPSGSSTTPTTPIIPDTALKSVQSPMSVFQSATRGVTLSGKQPSRAMSVGAVKITDSAVTLDVATTEAGTARVFLWNGDPKFVPVWKTSCTGDKYGFEACDATDGAAPAWGPSMGGRLLGKIEVPVAVGSGTLSLPIDGTVHGKLAADSLVLVSFESASEGVNAWSFPVTPDTVRPTVAQLPPTATTVAPGTELKFRATDETGLDKIVVKVFKDRAGIKQEGSTDANGALTVTHTVKTAGYPEGRYLVRYSAFDLAGNFSGTKIFLFDVKKTASTTRLGTTHPVQSYGTKSPAVLTATVKLATGAAGVGQIRFRDGARILVTKPLSGGRATLSLSGTLPMGNHNYSAEFLPSSSATTAGSSGTTRVIVTRAVSKTTLKAAATTVKAGRSVLMTTTVTLNTRQSAAGSVQYRVDGRVIATVRVSGGVARYTLPGSTKVGAHRVITKFVPSSPATVGGSSSALVTVTVRK